MNGGIIVVFTSVINGVEKRKSRNSCEYVECSLYDNSNNTPCMPAFGSGRNGIMIVGEAPGVNEDKSGRPFVKAGRAGSFLHSVLDMFDIRDSDCVITNAFRCYFDKDKVKPRSKDLLLCKNYLLRDIDKYEPKVIFALGDFAVSSLLGYSGKLEDIVGEVVPWIEKKCYVVPLLHPIGVLRREFQDKFIVKWWVENFSKGLEYVDKDSPKYRQVKMIDVGKDVDFKWFVNYLYKCKEKGLIVFDLETYPNKPYVRDKMIIGFGVTCEQDKVVVVDFRVNEKWFEKWLDVMSDIVSDKNVVKVLQNFAFEYVWLKEYGLKLVEPVYDVMLFNYLLKSKSKVNSLKYMAWVNFGLEYKDYDDGIDFQNIYTIEHEKLVKYNAMDVMFTYDLCKKLLPRLSEDKKLWNCYNKLLVKAGVMLAEAQYRGVLTDFSGLDELKNKFVKKLKEIENRIYHLPEVEKWEIDKGERLLLTSSKQVGEFLRDYYGVTDAVTKKGNLSASELVLKKVDNEFCRLLLDYRGALKIVNTYLDGLVKKVWEDGLIHTDYLLVGTGTGRLSSTEPNLQNIPKRQYADVRALFVAPKGKLLMSCDYSQWEVRVLQMYARDKQLGYDIKHKIDFHALYAKKLFKCDENHTDFKKFRHAAKNGFVFATIYGARAKTIVKGLWKDYLSKLFDDEEEAVKFVVKLQEDFFERYKGVKEYQTYCLDLYEKEGYVETYFGRKRYAPLTVTMILNTPIQSTASDFTLMSAIRLCKRKLYPRLLIHDDITLYVDEKYWKEQFYEIKECMTKYDGLDFVNVPIDIEAKIGENWYEMYDIVENGDGKLEVKYKKEKEEDGGEDLFNLNDEFDGEEYVSY